MQRSFLFNFCFLLAALLIIFIVGCAKAPQVIEQPKPVEQPVQVTPKPVEPKPAEQPPQVTPKPAEQPVQPPQLPVERGALVITSEPMGASVSVDDTLMGTTPLALKDVPTGSYRVEMELEHYEIWRGNADVKHQQTAEMRAELEPKPGALEVSSKPSGAKVRVDGKEVGVTPYSGWVSADKEHTVFISADGHRFETRKVTVQPVGKEVVSVVLEELKVGEMGAHIIGKDGAEMILIPAGEFIMGSPKGDDDEHPQHTVFLDTFYIDKYEVTNAQYKQFMDATGRNAPKYWNAEIFNQPNQPVVGVTWADAFVYAKWWGKRLPTEAEWEKAARGTDGRKYPWGNEWDGSKCNSAVSSDGYKYPAPVGSFPAGASPYGVMDMAGNVWEWCADWYGKDYYSRGPQQNPKGPDSGTYCVFRGGSWLNSGQNNLRCAVRLRGGRGRRDSYRDRGFRCAQDVKP